MAYHKEQSNAQACKTKNIKQLAEAYADEFIDRLIKQGACHAILNCELINKDEKEENNDAIMVVLKST
ncbi:hypothetical protein ABN224_16380 [Providencia rettgeri]